jgi:excisionase family DNA binding protein
MNAASDRPWLTVTEIAEHLRVAPITIYRWLEQHRIPAHRVGRQWRFQVAEVDAWVLRGAATEPDNKPHPENAERGETT